MKPGDLVRFKQEYTSPEDKEWCYGRVGMVMSLHSEMPEHGGLFEVLMNGILVGGFGYELEAVE